LVLASSGTVPWWKEGEDYYMYILSWTGDTRIYLNKSVKCDDLNKI
jgi:hypothetical protein